MANKAAATTKKTAAAPAAKKTAAKAASKTVAKKATKSAKEAEPEPVEVKKPKPVKVEWTPWLLQQKQRLIELRDELIEAMDGVAKETIRSRAEGSEASAFGQHQADAGSDAYDRDFALQLLSKEQDALYEIEEALRRIELGSYGICEMSNKTIPQIRMEALPFARYTVECQADFERTNPRGWGRRPSARPLFGAASDSDDDEEEEGSSPAPAKRNDDNDD
jgi:DnaK suppressor protein